MAAQSAPAQPTVILTTEQLAERLGVTPWTIKNWRRQGRIPSIEASHQVRLFDWEDVVAALKKRTADGKRDGRR